MIHKQMRRILAVVLGFVMIFNIWQLPGFSMVSRAANIICSTDYNLKWELAEDGTLTISGKGAMRSYIDPAYCQNVKKVVIKDGVTSIGDSAFFDCSNLTDIVIPNSVTSMGKSCFWNCSKLKSITIPDGVTNIGKSMFAGCSGLMDISIPDSVTSIGEGAFFGCSSLKSITIPNKVTSIGDYAFSGCSSLTDIIIPKGVKRIGNSTFFDCEGLTNITIPNSVTSVGKNAFYYCYDLTGITLPESVTSIGEYAFAYSGLKSVMLPHGLKSIGEGAFYCCKSLIDITIPKSIDSIGQGCFSADMLKNLNYEGTKTSWSKLISGVDIALSSLTKINYEYLYSVKVSIDNVGKDKIAFIVFDKYTGERLYNTNWVYANQIDTAGTVLASKPQIAVDGIFSVATSDLKAYADMQYGRIDLHYVVVEKTGYKNSAVQISRSMGGMVIPIYMETKDTIVTVEELNVYTVSKDGYKSSTTDVTQNTPRYFDLTTDKDVYMSAVASVSDSKEKVKYVEVAVSEFVNPQSSEVIARINPGDTVKVGIDKFKTGKDYHVYVRGVDGSGHKGKWKKTSIETYENGFTNGMMEFGDDFTFSVPYNWPIIGDSKINVSLFDGLPYVITREGNTVRVAINIGDWEATDEEKWKNIKHVTEKPSVLFDSKVGEDVKKFRESRKKLKSGKGISIGKSKATFDVWGYLEGDMYTGELSGKIAVSLGASYSHTFPYSIGPVPMVFDVELKGSVGGSLKGTMKITDPKNNYSWTGEIKPSAEINFATGPGFGNIAKLTAGAGGNISSDIKYDVKRTKEGTKKELSATAKLTLKCTLTAKILFWTHKIDFAKKSINLTPDATPKTVALEESENLYIMASVSDDLMNLDNYTLDRRRNLIVDSEISDEDVVSFYIGADSNVICPSVCEETAIVSAETNDVKMVVYTIDDIERTDANRYTLAYSVKGQGDTWSSTKCVLNDGTADFAPTILTSGDDIYLAWINEKEVLDEESMTQESSAAATEIVFAKYDKENDVFEVLYSTDNEVLDNMPQLGKTHNGIILTWVRNNNNNLLCNDNDNSMMYIAYQDGVVSDEIEFKSNVMNLIEYRAGMIGNQLIHAYMVDEDGDYTTAEDRKIYIIDSLGNEVNVIDEENLSNIQFNSFKGINSMFWYQSDEIYYLGSTSDQPTSLLGDEIVVGENYHLLDIEGKTYLTYLLTYVGEETCESAIISYIYDDELELWGDPIKLAYEKQFMRDFVYIGNISGQELLYLDSSNVELDEYGSFVQLKTKTTKNKSNLVIDMLVSNDYEATEEGNVLPLSFVLGNEGTETIKGIDISIVDEFGTIISEQDKAVRIMPGELVEVEVVFDIPDEISENTQYSVIVTDLNDNQSYATQEITVGLVDFTIYSDAGFVIDNVTGYNAVVENVGNASSSGTVVIREGSEDGKIITEISFDELQPGGTVAIRATVDADMAEWEQEYMTYYVQVIADKDEDDLLMNNDVFYVRNNEKTYYMPVFSYSIKSDSVTDDIQYTDTFTLSLEFKEPYDYEDDLTYQWYRIEQVNGEETDSDDTVRVPIDGATNRTYTETEILEPGEYQYVCEYSYESATEEMVVKVEVGLKDLTPVLEGSVSKAFDNTTTVPEEHTLTLSLDGVLAEDLPYVEITGEFAYATPDVGRYMTVEAYNLMLLGDMAYKYTVPEKVTADIGTILGLQGWKLLDNKWFYFENNKPFEGWMKYNDKWYYFDSHGMMLTDTWIDDTYYMKSSGVMATNEWVDGAHYVDPSGVLIKDQQKMTGWKIDGANTYYYTDEYIRAQGWMKINNKWYYFDSKCIMKKSCWIEDTYYMTADGSMATDEWINGKYYVDSNGKYDPNKARPTGWNQEKGVWYYYNTAHIRVTGWQKISDKWYYFNSNGAMMTGWQRIDNVWYYFKSGGAMVTGWQKLSDKWYYFDGGAMTVGWKKIDNKWYYFGTSGVMTTEWKQIDNKWYYFNTSGVMVSNTTLTIDGKKYTFNASGVWVK